VLKIALEGPLPEFREEAVQPLPAVPSVPPEGIPRERYS
jgi:hypothetical protein